MPLPTENLFRQKKKNISNPYGLRPFSACITAKSLAYVEHLGSMRMGWDNKLACVQGWGIGMGNGIHVEVEYRLQVDDKF